MQEIDPKSLQDLTDPQSNLPAWLESCFVVYKSVGVGLMDLAIGQHLLQIAESQDVGLKLDEF